MSVTREDIMLEAKRGRDGMPVRRNVIIKTATGYAVYNVKTSERRSRFYRNRDKALEAFAAVEAGIVLAI